MTYREQRRARAERLREWAGKREGKAQKAFDRAHDIADQIPLGQPILVGHHSERHARRDRDKIDNSMRAGVEHGRKAEQMNERADNIEAALDRSIYSDDPDAIEQLKARIAELEAERIRIKAFNASCRKGSPDLSLLDDRQKRDYLTTLKVSPGFLGKNGQFPAYVLANLSGNITRNRKRVEEVRERQERSERAEASPRGVLIVGDEFVNVTFAEKPERTILNALKAAGFHWAGGSWGGYRARLPEEVLNLTSEGRGE